MTLKEIASASSPGSPSTRPGPPIAKRFHRQDVPSAGTWPLSAPCRQPIMRSGSIWPVMWRVATGSGCLAFRMQFSGALTVITDNEPSLLGTFGREDDFDAEGQKSPGEKGRKVEAEGGGGRGAGKAKREAGVGTGQPQ